jgi:hypothetical protein
VLERGSNVPGDTPVNVVVALERLHTRVIAIENVLIALLSDASETQLERTDLLATLIAPRIDATQHPLTLQAAVQMTDLLRRAAHLRRTSTG